MDDIVSAAGIMRDQERTLSGVARYVCAIGASSRMRDEALADGDQCRLRP